ncbi:MAG: hypothetical protein CMJ81_14605 [Planctomycetaceae bacterium]|nr:hypothetical protein [Planctomycetaceae bacterium]MBP60891.1 hypothetical protein [Planctomycetaceae bacterium]
MTPRPVVPAFVLAYALLLGSSLITGCGSAGPLPTYPAGGRVTFVDGTPLAGGTVEFRPVDNPHVISSRGSIQPDGKFQLGTFRPGDGAVEGEHQALVVPPLFKGDRDEVRVPPQVIDPQYRRYETSGLRFTVSRDVKTNDFEIKVKRGGS